MSGFLKKVDGKINMETFTSSEEIRVLLPQVRCRDTLIIIIIILVVVIIIFIIIIVIIINIIAVLHFLQPQTEMRSRPTARAKRIRSFWVFTLKANSDIWWLLEATHPFNSESQMISSLYEKRQDGSPEGHGQGQLDRRDPVAQVSCATAELAGVAGTQEAADTSQIGQQGTHGRLHVLQTASRAALTAAVSGSWMDVAPLQRSVLQQVLVTVYPAVRRDPVLVLLQRVEFMQPSVCRVMN
ncbi:hypothetical protein EYF80_027972 [Liparis tanakae]|uniref:Uncharacterized protein n=1 Tax=Liparis tanakae TaxID=230148 RepID=A0A4Z2H9C0_9TELE|nr:hypothetical protein EYF80_027972 [Liparis tanakae]